MSGKVFVLATPIGNLKDITLRGLEVLKEADFILAEDTRVVSKLLNHFEIKKPVISFFEHSPKSKLDEIASYISAGKNLVLVTDAGTPNVSDPGYVLIEALTEKFGNEVQIVPVPGASSLTALISICHFSLNEFVFLGFPPQKKGRQNFFNEIITQKRPVIIFESIHRILKTMEQLAGTCPDREIVLAKELTKKFERVWRGKTSRISQELAKLTPDELKGEFVLALNRV